METIINRTAEGFSVVLKGRIDTPASEDFAKDIQPVIDEADKNAVLDFTDLQYICSSGLRVLLTLRKETIAKGGHISIIGMNPDIAVVFQMTGFNNLFDIKTL